MAELSNADNEVVMCEIDLSAHRLKSGEFRADRLQLPERRLQPMHRLRGGHPGASSFSRLPRLVLAVPVHGLLRMTELSSIADHYGSRSI